MLRVGPTERYRSIPMSGQRSILVVDDDRLVRNSIVVALETAGFRVWGVASGDEAVRLAGHLHPDVVVTDLRMPGMDGVTLLGRLRDAGYPAHRLVLYSAAPPADPEAQSVREVVWVPKAPGHQALLELLEEATHGTHGAS
jgi:CheY-like chemotaxis protein